MIVKTARALMLIAIVGVFFCVSEANAWWNEDWEYRRKISFSPGAVSEGLASSVTGIPVLVRLHMGNFDFANAAEDGHDIRFVSSDDQTPLTYHIERYDTLEEMALIWVKIPSFASAQGPPFIWMYYGNEESMGGGGDEPGTYDVNHSAVFHFDQVEGNPLDSTAYENTPAEFSGGLGLPSVIGLGASFNGFQDRMVIPASPSLGFAEGLTFSGWVKISGPVNRGNIFSWQAEGRGVALGVEGTSIFVDATSGSGEAASAAGIEFTQGADLTPNSWHHLAMTLAPGRNLRVYLDGTEIGSVPYEGEMPQISADVIIGSDAAGENFFAGEVDEVRISKVARSVSWIKAAYAAEGPEGAFSGVGQEMMSDAGGGLPVFYLKTIIENITLDGMVIIVLLLLLALWSWIVFLAKARFLIIVGKENKQFNRMFVDSENVLELKEEGEEYDNSTLFRVYNEGWESLKKRLSNPDDSEGGLKNLSTRAINAFKAALERGYVNETRRLNSFLVILTMAITGGPFLGLLGTVWGVMNTFAAMAEAGEANIMAIAPGVASALSTTVVGLIVAIPALFAYNYLTGKIRDLTAETTVFIDQFAIRVEEKWGAE